MKTILIMTILSVAPCFAQEVSAVWKAPDDYFKQVTTERTHEDSTGFYVIRFVYNPNMCSIPATLPAGQPHYGAKISVFQVTDGKRVQIGKDFGGEYTVNGCFEDEPKYLIKRARELAKEGDKHD